MLCIIIPVLYAFRIDHKLLYTPRLGYDPLTVLRCRLRIYSRVLPLSGLLSLYLPRYLGSKGTMSCIKNN